MKDLRLLTKELFTDKNRPEKILLLWGFVNLKKWIEP